MNIESDIDNWTTQLRKGLLELCIMNILATGEVYGYDLVKQLSEVEGLVVTEGTIYPLLSRLRRTGLVKTQLVESANGPARKYYAITPAGRRMQRTMNQYWGQLVRGVNRIQRESEAGHA
ncbi:MAG: PadR family transcriptional regulator [Candidatus Hydrogenedentota bacterium]